MPLPKGNINVISEWKENPICSSKACCIKDIAPDLNNPLPTFIGIGEINWFTSCSRSLMKYG